MGECVILRGGAGFDNSELTASVGKVRAGKTFLGNGSDGVQTGTLKEIGEGTQSLPLNGSCEIPSGIHSGKYTIKQSGISTQAASTVYPTGSPQTVKTTNKYMSGDIYLSPITNLTPANIKKGVKIRIESGGKMIEVTGTYEGYR